MRLLRKLCPCLPTKSYDLAQLDSTLPWPAAAKVPAILEGLHLWVVFENISSSELNPLLQKQSCHHAFLLKLPLVHNEKITGSSDSEGRSQPNCLTKTELFDHSQLHHYLLIKRTLDFRDGPPRTTSRHSTSQIRIQPSLFKPCNHSCTKGIALDW